jgi:retinol dehydrogenase-12
LGKYTAEQMLAKGAKVYAACRSKEKAEAAIEEIKTKTGKNDIQYVSTLDR